MRSGSTLESHPGRAAVLLGLLFAASASASMAVSGAEPAAAPPKVPASGGIVSGASFPISTDNPKNPHFESHLAIDPRDPKHMIATSTVHEAPDERSWVYATFDGGRHWVRGKTKSGDKTLFSGGDAVVYFDRTGTAFFVTGAKVGNPKVGEESKTLIGRSTDGGRTWSELRLPYRDRPWLAFDESGAPGRFEAGPYDHYIYFAGMNGQQLRDGRPGNAIVFSRSTDGGKTFTNGELLLHDDTGVDREATLNPGALTDMLVGPGGVLVVPFMAYTQAPGTPMAELEKEETLTNELRILVSDDGGRTFGAMRTGPSMHSLKGFRGMHSFGAARAAIDLSRGPNRSRIYVVWSEWNAGKKRYVVEVARSSDLGKTWATAIVNDDATDHDPSNPAIAVNGDGIVSVIWNDRRDDPKAECWRLYAALSVDGGETFGRNVRLSDAPTCTNTPGNWQLDTWAQTDSWSDPKHPMPGFGLTSFVPVRFPNGGDTQGLAADREGRFHAAWIDGRTSVLQLRLTDFSVDPGLVEAVRSANSARTSPSAPVSAERSDLTLRLELDVARPAIDFERGELSVSVRLKNPTAEPVRGPIDLVMAKMLSPRARAMGLANFRVANADDGGTGDGARWTFSAGPGEVLAAGARTPARVLKFAFDGGIPTQPDGYFEPVFHLYGRAQASH